MDILNNEKNLGKIETNQILNETKMTDKKARASDKKHLLIKYTQLNRSCDTRFKNDDVF